jgi:hypothetical protein
MCNKFRAKLYFFAALFSEPAFKQAEPVIKLPYNRPALFLDHIHNYQYSFYCVYKCPAFTQLVIIAFSAAVNNG